MLTQGFFCEKGFSLEGFLLECLGLALVCLASYREISACAESSVAEGFLLERVFYNRGLSGLVSEW